MIIRAIICILGIGTMSMTAHASNALRGKSFSSQAQKQSRKELKINHEFNVKRDTDLTSADVATIIPTNLRATNNGKLVRDRILQQSGRAIFNSSFIKESFLMKTAKKVEKTTKLDVSVRQQKENGVKEIEHKFNFDIQALKGKCKLTYKGFVDSKIEYKAASDNDTLLVSIEEKLSNNSKLALSHIKDRNQSRQLLQYQLSW